MLLRLSKEVGKLTFAGPLGLHLLCSPVLPMTAYGAFLQRAGIGLGPRHFSLLLSVCFQFAHASFTDMDEISPWYTANRVIKAVSNE